MPESSGDSMAKKPYSDTRRESHLSGRESSGGGTHTSLYVTSRRRGAEGWHS